MPDCREKVKSRVSRLPSLARGQTLHPDDAFAVEGEQGGSVAEFTPVVILEHRHQMDLIDLFAPYPLDTAIPQ